MPKIDISEEMRLHYQLSGDGPPLVLIHGLTGNLAVWHLKIVPLLQDHFRILSYDLRGHGYSSAPPTGYTVDDMTGDLLGLLDALDIDRPLIVGHSYGADVALYFAANHPERVSQVIAIEAALPALVEERANEDWEGWSYWADVLVEAGADVPEDRRYDFEYLVRTSLEIPKQWGPLKGLPRNPKKFLKLLDGTSISTDFAHVGSLPRERFAEIETPVWLMYAEGTGFMGTHDVLIEELPNAKPLVLPRTDLGHFGPLEQPEIVAQRILEAAATA